LNEYGEDLSVSTFPAALLALVSLLSVASVSDANADTKPPNLVLIVVDDLNDWVGCLKGHPQARTPNIDRLASRGTLFANAHCQAPLCNPSRTSFLTGLRPSTTGVYALLPSFRTVESLKDRPTLIQHFAKRGYSTFVAGKVFHDGTIRVEDRPREAKAWGDIGRMPYPPKKLVETPDRIKAMDWGIFPEDDREQGDWKIAESTIQHLGTIPNDQPFLVATGFRLPHVPCFASARWFDLYPREGLILPPFKENDRDDIPDFAWYLHWKLPEPRLSWLRSAHQWENLVRSYLASISFMDSQIGRVLDAVEKTGRADQTLVVLWSDHGWHLGEKGITGKNTLWERSTRVPLIFAGPGIASGAICRQPVELLDIYPTLVEFTGGPPVEGLEGHSLNPQLKNAQAVRPWPAITTHNRGNHAIRTLNGRYIRYANGSEEYYDLQADPNEWTNLASDPAYQHAIQDHARWLPQPDAPPVPGSAARLLERRGDLWYWEGKPIRNDDLER
jgi:arylsulfatase A-like enzyme